MVSKMSEEDQKFQKLWDFRRRDDEFDSSSDDSKSNSQCEPVLKKHKLVSSYILPQEDESSDIPKNSQFVPITGASFEFGKDNNSNVKIGKKTRAVRKNKRKDNNASTKGNDSNCIDGLRNFSKSILDDLKREREKMFARMKEEMRDFEVLESVSKRTRKRGSNLRKKEASPVKNNHKVVDEKVNHEPVTPDEKIPKSSLNSSFSLHEIASSSHLNANDVNEKLESRKSRHAEVGNSCYFQNQEQFRTIGETGSKDLGLYNQQCEQILNMNNRSLIPLHQRLDNGFRNIRTSQHSMEISTGGNIISGLRMNGSDLVANNYLGYMNPKIDGQIHAFGSQDQKDGQFYSNQPSHNFVK